MVRVMFGSIYNISLYISASESMGQMKRRTDSKVALNSVLFYHIDHFDLSKDLQQEGPRALDRSPEFWHMSNCIGMPLKRYHLKIFLLLAVVQSS